MQYSTTLILTAVLAMAWDATREAHGVRLGVVGTNQQCL